MSTAISFNGLASGLDTGAIIDAMLSVAKEPITRLENKRADYSTKLSLIGTLSSKLGALRKAAQSLDTSGELQSYSAKSTDDTKISATASSTAYLGSYEIDVVSLSQNERTYSNALAAKDQTGLVGTGQLKVKYGSNSEVTIDIDGTKDTLSSVAAKINDKVDGVTASVVATGSQYRLIVAGDNAGGAYGIAFNEDDTLNLKLDDAANQQQPAGDASIKLDGLTFNSSNNTFSDVIPGVTLEAKAKTNGTVQTVTIGVDHSAIQAKVQKLVDAYNDVSGFLKQQFTYNEKTSSNSLMGDATARSAQRQIHSIMFGEIEALSGDYTALSRIGVTTDKEGTMSVDSGKLSKALDADLNAVTKVFTYTDGNDATDNDGVAVRLERALKAMLQTPGGMIPTRQDGFNAQIADLNRQIDRQQMNADTYEAGLRKKFVALEQTLSELKNQQNSLSAR